MIKKIRFSLSDKRHTVSIILPSNKWKNILSNTTKLNLPILYLKKINQYFIFITCGTIAKD